MAELLEPQINSEKVTGRKTTIYIDPLTDIEAEKHKKRLGCSLSWLFRTLIRVHGNDLMPERSNIIPTIASHVPRRGD
jgi:hypothetical protein